MFCPQCGQQQVSETVRYCSRCGFMLEGVSMVIAQGGQLPMRYVQAANRAMSARSKGVRQGALLMLSTILLVPLVAVLSVGLNLVPDVIIPLVAITCFLGGLLRILYALLMEDPNAPVDEQPQVASYTPPPPAKLEARPPFSSAQASLNAAPAWRPQPDTGQIVTPPSVTENTTRLLHKDEPQDN